MEDLRVNDLYNSLLNMLKGCKFQKVGNRVLVFSAKQPLCDVEVMEEVYSIRTSLEGWKERTTYLVTAGEGFVEYFVETIDECIGEVQRMVEAQIPKETKSELRTFVTRELFEQAFVKFFDQVDINEKINKGKGSHTPFGFEKNKRFDGANFSQSFGQGNASRTPYINWWVVSIYYVVDEDDVVMGIEEKRYPHLNKMGEFKLKKIGLKKTNIAVFYESKRDKIDYSVLYNTFMGTCEKVMEFGLF